jgi:GntR family transcriptional regulator, carbon starvation induced regulator
MSGTAQGSTVPTEGATAAETAYRKIRRDILSGAFAPQQRLRLELLRQRYGLSFSPLREALNRLQTERLVVASALRGFSVAPISIEEMWDVTETRILIESEALRRSIAKGDDDWEARVVAAFHALDLQARRLKTGPAESNEENLSALETRHREFHHALIAGCNSARLIALADQLYVETQRYRLPALAGHMDSARDVAAEHKQIMEAALTRDGESALSLLADHYRRTADAIQSCFPLAKNPFADTANFCGKIA